ncbi:hypothetical protein IKF81_03915 [Candidatus Saccharibacteria bacterium]|nr:hypothetical protein [Candidatus Saccharibacteria bacterium]
MVTNRKYLDFSPMDDIMSGKYYFDNRINVGRVNRGVFVLVNVEPDSVFKKSHHNTLAKLKREMSEEGVSIPSALVLESWFESRVGLDWRTKPDLVLESLGVREMHDFPLFVATSSREVGEKLEYYRQFVKIEQDKADFSLERAFHGLCFVPVFFSRMRLESLLTSALKNVAN